MAEYCTLPELKDLGINPEAFSLVTADRRAQMIRSKSDVIDGYLGRFVLPLVSWGSDLRECCAVLVGVALIKNRGTNPETRDSLDLEEQKWITWLTNVSKGIVIPRVVDSSPGSSPGVSAPRPIVISSRQRGFSVRGTGRSRGAFQGD